MAASKKKSRRNFSRSLLAKLPTFIRYPLIRRSVRIQNHWPDALTIKIAETEEELVEAYKLLYESYLSEGYMSPHPTQMRVLPQHVLPQTTTIVAKWNDEIIGTISLIRDNIFGLPIEKIFDLSERRQESRRLVEVSSLAVNPKFRGKISIALFPIFRFILHYSMHYFGAHEFVFAVNPSMEDMYRALLCADKLQAATKSYDFVNGAAAVGLYVDFNGIEERFRSIYKDNPAMQAFWLSYPTHRGNKMPVRTILSANDPVITPKLLSKVFFEKAQLLSRLTKDEMRLIPIFYPQAEFQELFRNWGIPLEQNIRSQDRVDTQIQVEIGRLKEIGEAWNVSLGGMMIKGPSGVAAIGKEMGIRIWISHDRSFDVAGKVTWIEPDGLFGLKIERPSRQWVSMVNHLHESYDELAEVHPSKRAV